MRMPTRLESHTYYKSCPFTLAKHWHIIINIVWMFSGLVVWSSRTRTRKRSKGLNILSLFGGTQPPTDVSPARSKLVKLAVRPLFHWEASVAPVSFRGRRRRLAPFG